MNYLENAKKINWHYFNQRKRSPFYNWISIDSLVTKKIELTDLETNATSWLTIDGWGSCPDEDFQKVRQYIAAATEKDPKFLLNIIDAYKEGHDKALKIWQEIKAKDWTNSSSNDLAEALNKYVLSRQPIDPWLNLPLIAEVNLESKLQNELTQIFPNDSNAFTALTTSIYPSTQAEELLERTKIKNEDELKKHWQKYRWISDTLMTLDYLPLEYFSKKESAEETSRVEFDKYYSKIKDESVRVSVDTIQKSIWFRSFRIESFYYSTYLILNLLEMIAQKLKIKTEDLVYLTPIEIIDLLQTNKLADPEEIKNRKYGFIQYWLPGEFTMVSGSDVDKWIETINPGYTNLSQDISGQVAYPGKVKGKAIVIMDLNELPKLLEKENFGAILVTHGTNPKYVPYLNKIAGIITDEGGVLCHAAIISREMRIPCMIGTKVATKVLHTADTVELDADKGVIKYKK